MIKVVSGPSVGQVSGESSKKQAAERGAAGAAEESILAMDALGRWMVEVRDADPEALRGRKLVTYMMLNEDESARVNKGLGDEQAGLAAIILGGLKKE